MWIAHTRWSLARRRRRQGIVCTHGRRRQVGWHIRETRTRRGRRRRGGRWYGDASNGCCWNVEVYECWIGDFALGVCRPLLLFLPLHFLAFGVFLAILIPRLCVQYNLLSRRWRVFRRRKPTLRSRPPSSSATRLFLRIRWGWCSLRPGGRWRERLCALHHRQHTVFNESPLLGLRREYSFCLSMTTVALPASASSSASLRIGDLGAMLRMCPSFGRSWLRDGRRMKQVMGNVAAISLGRPPGRRCRLSHRRIWSLGRCLLNCRERTRFRVGRVDGVMVTFL